jgi:hypothetical protein
MNDRQQNLEYKSFYGKFSNGRKGVASFFTVDGIWTFGLLYNGNAGLNESFTYSVNLGQGNKFFTILTTSELQEASNGGFDLQYYIANYFDANLINLPISLSTKFTNVTNTSEQMVILGTPEEYIQENNYIEILDSNNNLATTFTFDQQTGNSNSGLSHIRGHVFIGILIILLICLYIYKYKFNGRITFPKYSTHIPSF